MELCPLNVLMAPPSNLGKYAYTNVASSSSQEEENFLVNWYRSCPTRTSQLKRLKQETFDVLVIGGGCVGAGVALEGSTRGLKVGMIERSDIAAGTSGRSTKLIHGGIR